MSMSSVFVVTNALRLRLFRPRAAAVTSEENSSNEKIQEETKMETVIKVNGMMCKHCKATVEKVCKAVPGTVDAVANLEAGNVTVTGSPDVEALKQAIRDADYEVVE